MQNISTIHASSLNAKRYTLYASSGFTIIETLIAVAVLLIAITAPLTLAEQGLASAAAAREEITAFYLAQEVVEFVRNMRDENALTGAGGPAWLKGLEECLSGAGCGIDATASGKQIVRCDENDDCRLSQYKEDAPKEEMRGLYGYPKNRGEDKSGEWGETVFTRKVFLAEILPEQEAEIRVEVSWSTKGLGEREVLVKSHVLNWYSP